LKYYWIYEYPVGPIGVAESDGRITYVFFTDENGKGAPKGYEKGETPLIQRADKQLREYFAGERKAFDLPLEFIGTDFQRKVWAALMDVPYGEIRHYGDIAARVGSPKAARAVGMANHDNPIVIICPCHRIIGSNGSLTGYGGGLPMKEYLLDLEGYKICKTKNSKNG